ncbi:MAG: hypothetical protein HY077_04195 [Elusimicrobia bacterium]|nr:hypothetical protein [Elusimicrobiota bacterium]
MPADQRRLLRLAVGPLLGLTFSACAPRLMNRLAPAPDAPASDPIAARFSRAQRFLDDGRPDGAVQELRAAERELRADDPRRLEAYERLGMVYVAAHEWEPAHGAFLQALSAARDLGLQGPLLADSYAGIGFCLAAQTKYFRAAQYLRRGLEMGPDAEVRRRAAGELSACLSRVGEDQELDDFGPEFTVTKITINAKWTEDFIIMRRIPFRVGDSINGRDLALARAALYRMNLFKAVEVSTAPLEGGAAVTVSVKDGWYVLPFPLISAGAGSSRFGAIIEARNVFSQAESMDLQILRGKSGSRTALGGDWEGWSGRFERTRQAYSENIYADGGYSAIGGLGTPLDANNFSQFGEIVDSYGKTTDDTILSVERAFSRRWSVEGGFDRGTVGYNSPGPFVPPDAGKQGNIFAAVKYGGLREGTLGLGGILGFGDAGLEERLKPMRRPQWGNTGEFRVIEAGRGSRSSFGYGEFLVHLQTSYSWGFYETISLTAAGGHGASLPDSKLLATGRTTALQGTYSREFRGPTAAGASLGYGRRLAANRWGAFQGGVFAEDARAWFHNTSKDKQGLGVSLYFRFWRFPLPLGVSYTYCLDDRNGLVSGAIGGRF